MTPRLHRYPALYLALGLATGVVVGRLVPASVMPLCLGAGVACAGTALAVFTFFRKTFISPAPLLATALVVIAAVWLGAAGYMARYGYASSDEVARRIGLLSPETLLHGHVVSAPRRDSVRTGFTLELEAVGPEKDPVRGRVRLTLREAMPELGAGQRIEVKARLAGPQLRHSLS